MQLEWQQSYRMLGEEIKFEYQIQVPKKYCQASQLFDNCKAIWGIGIQIWLKIRILTIASIL